jgi:hypothetical protein
VNKKISGCAAATAKDQNKQRDRPIVIERGIPISTVSGEGDSSERARAIKAMEIGESFEIKGCSDALRTAIYVQGRSYGVKLVTRKTDKGYRFWRITWPVLNDDRDSTPTH